MFALPDMTTEPEANVASEATIADGPVLWVQLADAVMILLFVIPKETLFELENTQVPLVFPVWAPAAGIL